MAQDFPHASVLEGIRFTAQIGAPNIIQGLFSKRELPVKIASRLGTDHLGYPVGRRSGEAVRTGPVLRPGCQGRVPAGHPSRRSEVRAGRLPGSIRLRPGAESQGYGRFPARCLDDLPGRPLGAASAVRRRGVKPDQPVHPLAQSWAGIAADTARELAGTPIRWAGHRPRLPADDPPGGPRRQRRRRYPHHGSARRVDGPGQQNARQAGSAVPGIHRHASSATSTKPNPAVWPRRSPAPQPRPAARPARWSHWMFALKANQAANVLRALAVLATHPEQQREAAPRSPAPTSAPPQAWHPWTTWAAACWRPCGCGRRWACWSRSLTAMSNSPAARCSPRVTGADLQRLQPPQPCPHPLRRSILPR